MIKKVPWWGRRGREMTQTLYVHMNKKKKRPPDSKSVEQPVLYIRKSYFKKKNY
jgi:hypothetical protein